MANLKKILGGVYSLHLIPITSFFNLQWLQIYRKSLGGGSMHLSQIGEALAPANPVQAGPEYPTTLGSLASLSHSLSLVKKWSWFAILILGENGR